MAAPSHTSAALDWAELRADALRRMRYHLRGWDGAFIDDATQDVMARMSAFVGRSGPPRNPRGLLSVLSRRVAVDYIRQAAIGRRHEPADPDDPRLADDGAAVDRELLAEETRWCAFLVLAWFRRHKAECHEVAMARYDGESLKSVALRTGQPHAALLQRWVRCAERLRRAVARGELALDPPPRRSGRRP